MLFGLFERTMKRRGVRDSDPFDWEKAVTDNLGLSGVATPTANRDNNKVDANVDNNQVSMLKPFFLFVADEVAK
jgi:tau tubulin kinase